MSDNNIHVTVVRPGKSPVTETVAEGTSVEAVLQQAGIAADDYKSWTVTGQGGATMELGDSLTQSVTLICGDRMSGAAR